METEYMPTEQEQQEAFEYFDAAKTLPTIAEKKDVVKGAIKDQILSGYLNPLEFYRQAKIVADVVEELKKDPDIFDAAWTEREKYGKGKAVINGATIDCQQRTTHNYKLCNDPEYNRLYQALKDREAFLKSLKEPITIVDTQTGETATIQPPTITISNFFTVKI